MEQAAFAAHRPQGRALVRVQAAGPAALEPTGTAMDIVTDDMPFLVDSVTMACTGTAWKCTRSSTRSCGSAGTSAARCTSVLGVSDGSPATHDEINESWTHLEIEHAVRAGRGRGAGRRPASGCSATSGSRSRTTRRCTPGR